MYGSKVFWIYFNIVSILYYRIAIWCIIMQMYVHKF